MSHSIEIRQTRQAPHLKIQYEAVCVIKNFHDLRVDKCGSHEESSSFWNGNQELALWIYSGGYDTKHSQYVSIRFVHMNDYEVDLDKSIHVITSIIDEDGVKHSTKSAFITSEYCYDVTFKDFVLREDLLKTPKLLPNGELRIAFKITSDTSDTNYEISSSQINQLELLRKTFDSAKYTDFTFIVEGKKFNVHRAILASRSPVFEAMFDSQMRESNEAKVEITDIEAKVMEKLLRFVYVGELQNFENLADKILVAAEKYQIDELKQLCEGVLFEQLSLSNVYDILRLADENNAEDLKKKAIRFFRRKAHELSKDASFKTHLSKLPGHLNIDILCDFV